MKQLAPSKCPNQQNMRCEISAFGITIKTSYPVERCCAVEESKLWKNRDLIVRVFRLIQKHQLIWGIMETLEG